jgi:glycosyltransferase involved in cell wall biosynthesis
MAQPTVDVSVLVPVLNEGAAIAEVVRAMTAQRFDGTVELIFADGRSSDDTRAQLERLAREDPRIRVLENPRRGVASGLNVCLGAARGRYVARMDGHALFPPTYLRDGVERLRRASAEEEGGSARTTWVAGPQVPEPRGRMGRAIAAALGTRLGQGGSRRWGAAGAAAKPMPAGAWELDTGVFCGVWRREDVLAKGGWDEEWWCNEDSELAARFQEAGERIVCVPEMAARYLPRESLSALWRQYRLYGRYRAKTAGRHPHSLRRSALLPPLLTLDLLACLLAPRPLRRLAGAGQAAYLVALLIATVEAGGDPEGSRGAERVLVPAALATMHLAHGLGFLEGCARWGMPWRALRSALGGAGEPQPYDGPVHAPSLNGADR